MIVMLMQDVNDELYKITFFFVFLFLFCFLFKKKKKHFYAYHIFIEKSSFMNSNIHLFSLANCHILNVFVLILISMQDVNDKL